MDKREEYEDPEALSMSQADYVEKRLERIKLDDLDDTQRRIIEDELKHQHKQRVRQAFEDGLEVPKEVMGDYDFLNDDEMSDEELEDFIKKHSALFEAVDDQIWESIDREIREERKQKSLQEERGGIDTLLNDLNSYKLFKNNPFRRSRAYLRYRKPEKVDKRKTLLAFADILLVVCFVLILVFGLGYLLHLIE